MDLHSLYCYENSDVLKNKLNIKDETKLKELETYLTIFKSYELRKKGVTGDFSKQHLKDIHKYLFGDLYEFAGEFRNENIAKDDFRFADPRYISEGIDTLLLDLAKENKLKGLDKKDMVKRLAYYLSELNVLHPFREGNGRTIREFIRQLALYNGYLLDLRQVSSDEFFEASVESVIDTKHLEHVLDKCLILNEEE